MLEIRPLIKGLVATGILATVLTAGMAMSTTHRASAATTSTVPSWEFGRPSCTNTSDAELDYYASVLGTGRNCFTGATRVFRATTYQSVWLDVRLTRWPTGNYATKSSTSTRYKATCSATYNPAVLNVDNGDCVGSDSNTRWHGPQTCGEYAGLTWCGDIWVNANTQFTSDAKSIYSVEQALTWWNASARNRAGGLGAWQAQTKTWWLNAGGFVYSSSLSAIQTLS